MTLPSLEDVAKAVSDLAVGLKPLGDAAVPVALATYSVETSPEIKVAGKALQLTAGFEAAIEEFNSLDDADGAGILGVDPGSKPPILLTPASAWLKYRLGGGLRLDGGGEIGSIGFSFDAKARIELFDYRRHARDQILAEAVTQDLSRPRVIFSLASVRSLAEGEALALRATGSLTLGMTLSWADVVTSGLTSLTAALKAAAPVSITLDAGLTTSVEVSLGGDFALLFARDRAGTRITVKKATSSGLGISATAGVAASFTNLDKAVTGVLESLLGAKYETVVSALQKANPGNLTASERKLFEKVAALLGLAEEVETVTELLERLSGLRAEVQAKLVEIARSRVEVGLAYEYSRTKTNEVLIDVYVVDDAALPAVHPHLVRGDVRALLAEVRDTDRFDLKAFLHRSTLETKGSWGFTFSAGKYLKAKGVDTSALVKVEERNEEDWSRLTYEAVRGYAAAFAGDEYSWTVNFLATMKSFARTPNASDFDYGLHLAYSPTRKPKAASQAFLTDLAALWGAGSSESSGQELLSAALKMKPGRFTVSQAIPEIALAEIAERAAADTDRVLLASAMAAALPYRKEWPERRVLGLRRSLYGPILHSLIRESSPRPSGLSAVSSWVREELRRAGASNPYFEGQLGFTGSLVDVLHKQGYFEGGNGFLDHVRAFERGVRSLARVLGSGAAGVAPNEIVYAYDQMKPFFCQSFFIRTVAHYFFLLAQDAGVAGLVERAASLEHGDGPMVLIQ